MVSEIVLWNILIFVVCNDFCVSELFFKLKQEAAIIV